MSNITLQFDTPFLSYEEYARRTGCSIHLVRRHVREGKLPIKPKATEKETPFINMVALTRAAAEQPFVIK